MIKTVSKWNATEHYEFFSTLPKGVGSKHFLLFKFDGVEVFKSQHTVISNMVKSIETDDFQAYDKERIEIIKTYAVKDKFGRIISSNGELEVEPTKAEEVQTKISELNEKYKEAIVEHDKNFNEIWELAHNESEEMNVPQIKFEDVPEGLSEYEMNYIFKHFLLR